MNHLLFTFYVKLQTLLAREEGQDLVEYGLIAALIAVATSAGMNNVATAINTLFSNISTSMA